MLLLSAMKDPGGAGLTEVFKVIGFMRGLGLETKCALITDGKISGFAKGPFICQVSPEAALGGPLAVIRDGDIIEMDIPNRKLNVCIDEKELQDRLRSWTPPAPRVSDGFLTVSALTRSMALELGSFGIRVNELCPASVESGMTRKAFQDPANLSMRLNTIPLGRVGTPEDLAGAAVFLCSQEASWITGASIVTDGGLGVIPPFGGPSRAAAS
jgi:hypothetical protein